MKERREERTANGEENECLARRADESFCHAVSGKSGTAGDKKRADILFFGDSYMDLRFWKTFYKDIDTKNAVNIGIGGTKVAQWYDVERDIAPFAPQKIVAHVGINDINAGASAEAVIASLQTLFEKIHTALPQAEIYFISICPSNLFPQFFEETKRTNAEIKEFIDANDYLRYIDVFGELVRDNKADSDLYADGLHLNAQGYVVWTRLIRKSIGLA